MAAKRSGRRVLKITGIILGILVVLLAGLHFWIQAHAKKMIEDMVSSRSNGKLKLKIQKLRFNYFSRKIELDHAVFYTTDTQTSTTSYNFKVDRMRLQAKALLPIIFKNQLLIDSLTLLNPTIEVTRLRLGSKPDSTEKKDISIPEEMGKVYKSIQDALKVLEVKRFELDNGTFTLINKIDPGQLPLKISNLYFEIDNLQVDSKKTGTNKILFSDNVVLLSNNQDILFPDGRHRLSFRNFRINLKKKLVEFDSCTIAATRGDSSTASFNVFFNALMLTNIDFDTLYKSEVIKADSVYCLNPTFTLDVDIGKRKGVKKAPPKLENIIQQLTGDLQLGYVVVNNASFNIQTRKEGVPSSFTFSNNNFEMQGLRVTQQAVKPIEVKSFAMAIRNYENFIKDSAYSVKFDSVLFKDNKITLSNFLFSKFDNGKVLNTISIPEFNLLGMSWDELVFERKLQADHAILYNPHITYTVVPNKVKAARLNLFQSLGVVNEFMDLQQIDIVNGAIDLRLKNDVRVQLDNASLSVKSHSLLESKRLAGIKNSLLQLRFENGLIHAGNLDIQLRDILYFGKSGQLAAGLINVNNKSGNTAITLRDVAVNTMLVDEASGNIDAEGIRWSGGSVKLNNLGEKKEKGSSIIKLKDVRGTNTSFTGMLGQRFISSQLSFLSFRDLEKKPGNQLRIEDLSLKGDHLQVKDAGSKLVVDTYTITDNKPSSFHGFSYEAASEKKRVNIRVPSLSLTPHVQSLIGGDIMVDDVSLVKPVIYWDQFAAAAANTATKQAAGIIRISNLNLRQPLILFTSIKENGRTAINWHGEQNSADFLQVTGLRSNDNSTELDRLNFHFTNFDIHTKKGKRFSTGNGVITSELSDIRFDHPAGEAPEWKATLVHFNAKQLQLDSIGKANGNLALQNAILSNLAISSSAILNLQQLAADNKKFQLKQFTGSYSDPSSGWKWSNLSFNREKNMLLLDSFSMIPTLSRESFIAKQSFQNDYMSLRTGALRAGPIDLDSYIRDKTINIGAVESDQLLFTDYKDKRLPFNAGIIKPLASTMLRNLPVKISIADIKLHDARVEYTEMSEKTNAEGVIPVGRMHVHVTNLKNYNLSASDSLIITATGYVLDTAWIRLKIKESYTDTLGGFLLTMQVRPLDLTLLNPVLVPMASVQIESGVLDTLSMRAVGREYLSWGEMKMFYHDLKIRLVKKGEEKKKSLMTRLITFFANSFVIRNNNTSRTGNVFFIRNRDRSAINYIIKIAFSGMTSSVGVANNKKLLRRYQKELGKRNLPPIELD